MSVVVHDVQKGGRPSFTWCVQTWDRVTGRYTSTHMRGKVREILLHPCENVEYSSGLKKKEEEARHISFVDSNCQSLELNKNNVMHELLSFVFIFIPVQR